MSNVAPPAGAWIETAYLVPGRQLCLVAPPAGAWIETVPRSKMASAYMVAPPAGAWIETGLVGFLISESKSRLPQARGLKPTYKGDIEKEIGRASRRRVD